MCLWDMMGCLGEGAEEGGILVGSLEDFVS